MSQDLQHAQTLIKHYRHRLSDWELEFLRSIEVRLSRGTDLTDKQQSVLDQLVSTYLGDTGPTVSEADLWR